MNKYIRVIEDSEEYITTRENLHDHILALQDSGFDFEGGIIKEANTIEELCDGICAIEKNGKLKVPYVGKTAQDLKVIIDLIDKDNYEVYGAIWTDKGLIYVAKMNDKGELELL